MIDDIDSLCRGVRFRLAAHIGLDKFKVGMGHLRANIFKLASLSIIPQRVPVAHPPPKDLWLGANRFKPAPPVTMTRLFPKGIHNHPLTLWIDTCQVFGNLTGGMVTYFGRLLFYRHQIGILIDFLSLRWL